MQGWLLVFAVMSLLSGCVPEQPATPLPTVEFLMLREGLCRVGWIRGKTVLSLSGPRPCPVEELRSYLP